jgi:translation elongation factor EF-G
MAAKKETVKESTAVTQPGPSSAMVALFQAPANMPDVSKLKRRSLPKLVKPDEVPVGGVVSGEILDVCKSPSSTVKGLVLHLRHASGQEFTFPATGTIRQALAPGTKNDDDKLMDILKKEVGKAFFAKRLEDGTTTKYSGKGEGPKRMFQFDVFTSEK